MKTFIFLSVIVINILSVCHVTKGQYPLEQFVTSERNESVLQSWQNMEKKLQETVKTGLKMVFPILVENFSKLSISNECLKNSMQLFSGMKDIRPWAMRFLDSSSKIIDGILSGAFTSLGSYEECVDIQVLGTKHSNLGQLLFRGQYCMIDLRPHIPPKPLVFKIQNIPEEIRNFSQRDTFVAEIARTINFFHIIPIRMGVCVPSGCSREDVNKMAKIVGDMTSMDAIASRCEIKTENKFDSLVIFAMSCYCFFGFLMLVGTAIDVYSYYTKAIFKSNFMRILLAFSFFTNFKKFIDTTQRTITCLDGMRVLCLSWIIASHTYLLLNPHMIHGALKAQKQIKAIPFQVILNGTFAVDTFFFIGGMLLSYLTVKHCVLQKKKMSVIRYIFHRILRLYPAYIFIMISVFMFNLMGSGPMWHESTHMVIEACKNNWWKNLLFINNFFYSYDQCLPHAWYIASDFQMYIGALIIILPLIRWPKVGISLAVFSIIACIFYSGFSTYLYNYPPTGLVSQPDIEGMMEFMKNFYGKPFPHISSYSVGILVGYLLIMKPNLKIPGAIQVLGWTAAFIMNIIIVYGITEWNRGVEPLRSSAILYAGTSRTIWTVGVAWMVVCCVTGHGGIINYILSWKIWIPLSRLTYLAYLVHILVIIVYVGNLKFQVETDHYVVIWMFFGHLLASYGIAFCIHMLVELPFVNIENIFLSGKEKKVEKLAIANEAFSIDSNLEKYEINDNIKTPPKADVESGGIDNKTVIYKL